MEHYVCARNASPSRTCTRGFALTMRHVLILLAALLPGAASGQTPYFATPAAIPGTLEAENFDRGGEGVAYHDNVKGNSGGKYRSGEDVDIITATDSLGGGYVINNFQTGEWLLYTVSVQAGGAYDIELRASSKSADGAFHVEVDGVNVSGSVAVPNTGNWNAFQWAGRTRIALAAGTHRLKIVADRQYFNLNSIRLSAAPAPIPYAGAAISLPGSFEAENFDRGGEGVGYHDSVKGNAGGQYRTAEDVDIIASTDALGGGYVVNNFDTGEWLLYSISVQTGARYDIELRAASAFADSAFHVEIDGVNITGSVAVPNTGGWSSFQWVGRKGVPLAAGNHQLKIFADRQFFNLNSVRVTPSADTQAPAAPASLAASAVSASRIDLSWSAALDDVATTGYRVYRNGVQIASLAATGYSNTGLASATTYSYTVAAYDAAGNVSPPSGAATATTLPLQEPYGGAPVAIPATFDAVNFDRGGEGIAYHDLAAGNAGGLYRPSEDVDIILSTDSIGGPYTVNNFETGEWLAYTIDVPAGGAYDLALRASSAFQGSGFHVELDGVNLTGNVVVPNTGGWNTFQWVSKNSLALPAGTHVLKVVADQQYFNLNSVRLTAVAAPPPVDPGSILFFCSFLASPLECGFGEQAKVPGRASLVSIARDGVTGVRLHTEPGDSNVAGSGTAERNDLALSQAATDCYEGREHWWAHSILFPGDYVVPPSGWGVVMDFHHTGPSGQANFHVDAMPNPTGLRLRGYGGASVDAGKFEVVLGPVVKNVWYDFVYQVRWSSGSDGFFNAWVNGVQKLAHRGPTLYAGMGCYLKLANYHTAFGQPSSVIHDRIVRGTSAASVSPGPLQGVLP